MNWFVFEVCYSNAPKEILDCPKTSFKKCAYDNHLSHLMHFYIFLKQSQHQVHEITTFCNGFILKS